MLRLLLSLLLIFQLSVGPVFAGAQGVGVSSGFVGEAREGVSDFSIEGQGGKPSAFGNTFLLNSLDGVVSGNFDLGNILKDATFSAVTAGLTASINIPGLSDSPLIPGFGTGQFTLSGLINAGLDGAIRSGLSSVVYGTDFGDGLFSSLVSYVADGVAGAAIKEVSDVFGHDRFSVEKLVSKALINCLAAEAGGAGCHAGALGTLVTEAVVASGATLGATHETQYRNRLELIAAIAGYFTSGGKGENVYATAGAALRDFDNNADAMGSFGLVLSALHACEQSGGTNCADFALEVVKDSAKVQAELTPILGTLSGFGFCRLEGGTNGQCGKAVVKGVVVDVVLTATGAAVFTLGGKVIRAVRKGGTFVDAKTGKTLTAQDFEKALGDRPKAKDRLIIPSPGGASVSIEVSSRIKDSPYAVRLAEKIGQQAQKDVDNLIVQLKAGNANPGIGTRSLGNDFFELRGRNAGRVIIKQKSSGIFDIVGKFQGHARGDKANSAIIKKLISDYGN